MPRAPFEDSARPTTPDNNVEDEWRAKQRRLAEARTRLLEAKSRSAAAPSSPITNTAAPPPPEVTAVVESLEVERAVAQRGDEQLPTVSIRARVETISAELGETNYRAKRNIGDLIKRYGATFVEEHLEKARAVETAGGMMTTNGFRRRSIGGVFFFLARQSIGEEVWKQMFPWVPMRRAPRPQQAVVAPTPPPAPRPKAEPGEARTVKVTLVGRPGPVAVRETCIETTMENRKAPDLPKGLPAVPKEPTRWRVFIAKKTWARVEPMLTADATDMLIVDGWGAYDAIASVMTVYALSASTAALQRSAKAPNTGSESAKK